MQIFKKGKGNKAIDKTNARRYKGNKDLSKIKSQMDTLSTGEGETK